MKSQEKQKNTHSVTFWWLWWYYVIEVLTKCSSADWEMYMYGCACVYKHTCGMYVCEVCLYGMYLMYIWLVCVYSMVCMCVPWSVVRLKGWELQKTSTQNVHMYVCIVFILLMYIYIVCTYKYIFYGHTYVYIVHMHRTHVCIVCTYVSCVCMYVCTYLSYVHTYLRTYIYITYITCTYAYTHCTVISCKAKAWELWKTSMQKPLLSISRVNTWMWPQVALTSLTLLRELLHVRLERMPVAQVSMLTSSEPSWVTRICRRPSRPSCAHQTNPPACFGFVP